MKVLRELPYAARYPTDEGFGLRTVVTLDPSGRITKTLPSKACGPTVLNITNSPLGNLDELQPTNSWTAATSSNKWTRTLRDVTKRCRSYSLEISCVIAECCPPVGVSISNWLAFTPRKFHSGICPRNITLVCPVFKLSKYAAGCMIAES